MSAAVANPIEMDTKARVKALYYIMQSMEGRLGGGEGFEGLYGSITRSGMQKVIDCLCSKCCLAQDSHIVDIGAGLGRPLLHALVNPGVASGFGIEIDRIKCDKAAAFLKHSLTELGRRGGGAALALPRVQCSSIEKSWDVQVKTLEPGTHAYSFWEGVPTEGKIAFGKLFAGCTTMKSVAVVQRAMRGRDPAQEMEEMGFGILHLVGTFPVSMSGSGRSFTAYVFNKEGHGGSPARIEAADLVGALLPPTPAAGDRRRDSLESSDTRGPPAHLLAGMPALADSNDLVHPAEEGGSLEPYPSTPTAKPSERLDSPVATPVSSLKGHLPGLPATPKSVGISGVPRRVPLPPKESSQAAASSGKTPSKAPAKSTARQSRLAVTRKTTEPARRSSRLKGLENAASGEENPTPAMANPPPPLKPSQRRPTKPKGVQKPRSPQKNTLEAAGFRSRRNATVGGGKAKGPLTFPEKAVVDRASVQARGLGSTPQLTQ